MNEWVRDCVNVRECESARINVRECESARMSAMMIACSPLRSRCHAATEGIRNNHKFAIKWLKFSSGWPFWTKNVRDVNEKLAYIGLGGRRQGDDLLASGWQQHHHWLWAQMRMCKKFVICLLIRFFCVYSCPSWSKREVEQSCPQFQSVLKLRSKGSSSRRKRKCGHDAYISTNVKK